MSLKNGLVMELYIEIHHFNIARREPFTDRSGKVMFKPFIIINCKDNPYLTHKVKTQSTNKRYAFPVSMPTH